MTNGQLKSKLQQRKLQLAASFEKEMQEQSDWICDLSPERFWERIHDANNRRNQRKAEWDDYLLLLEFFPVIVLQKYQLLLTGPDELQAFKVVSWNHRMLAKWMSYLVPGNLPLPQALRNHPEAKTLKARAEMSQSVLNLAIAVLPKSPDLEAISPIPADFWLAWELNRTEQSLLESGLLTGIPKPSARQSKEETVRDIRQVISDWESLAPIGKDQTPCKNDSEEKPDVGTLMLATSRAIAEHDVSFRNGKAYREFQKKMRAWLREIRSSPLIVEPRLINGELQPFGRNAPREARKAQGFVTKPLQKTKQSSKR